MFSQSSRFPRFWSVGGDGMGSLSVRSQPRAPLASIFPKTRVPNGEKHEGGGVYIYPSNVGCLLFPLFLFIISQGTKLGYLTSLERNGERE